MHPRVKKWILLTAIIMLSVIAGDSFARATCRLTFKPQGFLQSFDCFDDEEDCSQWGPCQTDWCLDENCGYGLGFAEHCAAMYDCGFNNHCYGLICT